MAKRIAFSLVVSAAAREELDALRAFEKRQISNAIEANLLFEPLAETRKKKRLGELIASFQYDPPLRELKVGEYRVYYNVNERVHTVYVHAIRHKPPEMTTEEVLR